MASSTSAAMEDDYVNRFDVSAMGGFGRPNRAEVSPGEGFDLVQPRAYDEPFVRTAISLWRCVLMVLNRRGLALAAAAVLTLSAALVAQKRDDKKSSDAQKKETLDIVRMADGAATGQPGAERFRPRVGSRRLPEGPANTKEYVPFTLTLDQSKVAERPERRALLARGGERRGRDGDVEPAREERRQRQGQEAGQPVRVRGHQLHCRQRGTPEPRVHGHGGYLMMST